MPIKFRDPNNTRSVELGAAHENHDHAHADLTGVTSDQHHAQDHAARHGDGGADEITITEAQISDLDHYDDTDANAAIDARVDKTFVDALNVDADTLDGEHASAFADASHNHTESDITDLDHYDSSDFATDHGGVSGSHVTSTSSHTTSW